jgi:hypothetical protein
MVSSGLLRRVALVRTDVSEEPGASRFLQEPHGVTTQKTPFFIVTAVKTSNLTSWPLVRERTLPTDRPPLVDKS